MTVKELESKLGIDRANIRFYEKEGLISPMRLPNGYRDYTDEDAEELRRIRLLRRLGVSIEEIRALQTGARDLSDTLAARESALYAEEAAAGRAAAVCRDIRSENAGYAGLDAAPYLRALDRDGDAPAEDSDHLPYAYFCPWRRYFARTLDLTLCMLPVTAVQLFLLRIRETGFVGDLLTGLAAVGLLLVLEPLLFHFWGWTPGKWLFGLTLRDDEGGRLSLRQAFERTGRAMLYGMGLNLTAFPLSIASLVCLGLAFWRAHKGEYQPWDEGGCYTVAGDRLSLRAGGYIAARAAILLLVVALAVQAVSPPHRGRLTLAQFVENCNDVDDFLLDDALGVMDENGDWAHPEEPNTVTIEVGDLWGPSTNDVAFDFDSDGYLTRVRYTYEGPEYYLTFGGERETVGLYALVIAEEGPLTQWLHKREWERACALTGESGTVTVGDYRVTSDCGPTGEPDMCYLHYEIAYAPAG